MKKHLDDAEKSPKQIAAAVLGLPDKTLRYKPSPDKWCILEILGHLSDMEILYAYVMAWMCCHSAHGCYLPACQSCPSGHQLGAANPSLRMNFDITGA